MTEHYLDLCQHRLYAGGMAVSGTDDVVTRCQELGATAVTNRKLRSLKTAGHFPKFAPGQQATERDVAHAIMAEKLRGPSGTRRRNYAIGYVLWFFGFPVEPSVVLRDLTEFYGEPVSVDADDAIDGVDRLLHDTSDRPAMREYVRTLNARASEAPMHGRNTERHETRHTLEDIAGVLRGEKFADVESVLRMHGATVEEAHALAGESQSVDYTGATAVDMVRRSPDDTLALARGWYSWSSRYMPSGQDFAVRAHQALEVAAAYRDTDGWSSLDDYPVDLRTQLVGALTVHYARSVRAGVHP